MLGSRKYIYRVLLTKCDSPAFWQIYLQEPASIARERLNNGDLRLPIRTNANGLPVGYTEDIRNLNENLDRETIRSILETIAENRFNPNVLRNLISNMSVETH